MAEKSIRFHAQALKIPLRMNFTHASFNHRYSQSVIVTAIDGSGTTGYGESCPRRFVTGETLNSCLKFVENLSPTILRQIHNLQSLRSWVRDNSQLVDRNPAAWCAIELALLDLFAKQEKNTIEQLLGLPPSRKEFRYSAVVGSGHNHHLIQRYIERGFTDFKLKLCGKHSVDRSNFAILLQQKCTVRIRVDANNLWSKEKEAIDYLTSLKAPLYAVEEPLRPFQFHGLETIARELNTKIVLDESFLYKTHFDRLSGDQWIINVRLSKLGGLLRTLDIAQEAFTRGIPLIIGCHVGESSLLTRAAIALGVTKAEIIAREGAFSTYLLQKDVGYPNLPLGFDGRLTLPKSVVAGPGFGVTLRLP